jgi:hypothetical protein
MMRTIDRYITDIPSTRKKTPRHRQRGIFRRLQRNLLSKHDVAGDK